MKGNLVLAGLCMLSLSACVTYVPSVPPSYTGPTASIKDTVMPYEATKADFFYLHEINGEKVDNSSVRTYMANQGNGLNAIKLSLMERPVPLKAAAFTIVGHTQYAAPIQALTNPVYQIEGVIHFTPEQGKTYIVKGDLGKNYSGVWVEDEATHQVIDHKIERRPAVAAAPEPVEHVDFPGGKTTFVAAKTLPYSIAIDAPVDVRPDYATLKVAGTDWHGCKEDAVWGSGAAAAIGERITGEVTDVKLFRQVVSAPQDQAELHLKSDIRAFCGDTRRTSFITLRGAGVASLHFTLERDGKVVWEQTIEKVVTDDTPEYSGSQFTTKKGAITHLMADSLRVVLAEMLPQLQAAATQLH